MKAVHYLIVIALVVALAWLLYDRFKGGTVTPGQAQRRGGSGVLKDPCPGDSQIWDAATERCIPLVEESYA